MPRSASTQVARSLVVGDPAVADVDALSEQPAFLGVGHRLVGVGHLRGAQRLRPVDRREVQVDGRLVVGQPLDRPDRGQSVEPRPDPSAPDEDAVVGTDLGPLSQQRLSAVRGLIRQSRRHDVDQVAKPAVALVQVDLDQVVAGEHPEPVIALALAGAEYEVGAGQVCDRVGGDDARPAALRPQRPGAVALGGLDHDRVVEVGDVAGVHPGQRVEQVRRQALGDDHVVGLGAPRPGARSPAARRPPSRRPCPAARPQVGRRPSPRSPRWTTTRASSSARIPGPDIRVPIGSPQTNRTRVIATLRSGREPRPRAGRRAIRGAARHFAAPRERRPARPRDARAAHGRPRAAPEPGQAVARDRLIRRSESTLMPSDVVASMLFRAP